VRAVLVGAVDSTRVALEEILRAEAWSLAGLVTLPPRLSARHSDYADLRGMAREEGAEVIEAARSDDQGVIAAVEALGADLAVIVGWSQICPPSFVAAAGGRALGYHPAPLPRGRGRAALPWTILLQEPISAASLFWIDEGVDSGPLLAQRFFHVAPDETATTLYDKHQDALREALREALPRIEAGEEGQVQDERYATYTAKRGPEDGRIDWTRPALEVERLIRAVTRPYPGAFTTTPKGRLTVWRARLWPEGGRHAAAPGQVVRLGQAGIGVRCGEGAIMIEDWTAEDGAVLRQHMRLGEPQ